MSETVHAKNVPFLGNFRVEKEQLVKEVMHCLNEDQLLVDAYNISYYLLPLSPLSKC